MAVLGRAVGMPNYHGTFIPELWAPGMQYQFEKRSTFQDISTTEYEGMISNSGDTVNINIEPTITIDNYVKGQRLNRKTYEPTTVVLEINQAKSYSLLVDDIDKKQSQPDLMSEFENSAGRRLAEEIDKTVLQGIYNSEATYNSGATAGYDSKSFNLGVSGTPLAITADTIVDVLTDVATVLDERDVPEENRWIVLPPVFKNLLMKSDLRDASFRGSGETNALNGKLPNMVAGFNIYISRQLYSAADGGHTCYYCLAGWKGALTFASQLVETRAIQANDTFGWYIDGLHVFGYKVVRAEGLAVLYAYKG